MVSRSRNEVLVGIPDIAGIANVTTSAVGNWRKRHGSFPIPRVQTPTGVLFDLREVERWLIENGKITREVPASAILWGLVDTFRNQWQPSQITRFLVALLVYLEACDRSIADNGLGVREMDLWETVQETPESELVPALRASATRIERDNESLAGLISDGLSVSPESEGRLVARVLHALTAVHLAETRRYELFEDLMSRVRRSDRFTGQESTPSDVTHLLVRLAPDRSGVLLDLAMGEGGILLMAAVGDQHDDSKRMDLIGYEINQSVAALAKARFFLYGVDVEIHIGNSLLMDAEAIPTADLVLLDPPMSQKGWGDAEVYLDGRWTYGPPPPGNADFAWLQIAANAIAPGGLGLVVLPVGSLFKGGREGEIRSRMVGSGVVEAVIELPQRLRPETSISIAIWVLRSAQDGRPGSDVLLVDASALGESSRSRYSMPEETIDRLAGLVHDWRDKLGISQEDSAIAVSVPIEGLADAGFSFQARRFLAPSEIDAAALQRESADLRRRLGESAAEMKLEIEDLLRALEQRQ